MTWRSPTTDGHYIPDWTCLVRQIWSLNGTDCEALTGLLNRDVELHHEVPFRLMHLGLGGSVREKSAKSPQDANDGQQPGPRSVGISTDNQ